MLRQSRRRRRNSSSASVDEEKDSDDAQSTVSLAGSASTGAEQSVDERGHEEIADTLKEDCDNAMSFLVCRMNKVF